MVFVVVGFLVISLIKIEPTLVTTRRELDNLNKKIAETEQSAFELERLGDYIKSDAYLERQARLKLNYKKPDEKVVYVYTRGTSEAQKGAEIRNDPGQSKFFEDKFIANLQSWWGYLMGE